MKHFSKIGYPFFGAVGFLFTFCQLTGRDLERDGNLVWTGGYCAKILLISLIAGIVVGGLLGRLAKKCGSREASGELTTRCENREAFGRFTPGCKSSKYSRKLTGRSVFIGSFLLNVLAFLPCYLAYYPGIGAYDFPIQMGQVTGGGYIDHHPILHTLMIGFFRKIGISLVGESAGPNLGMGLLTLFQVLSLAAVLAWGVRCAADHVNLASRKSKGLLALLQLYCMAYPFHWYMSVSVAKDIPFTVFFLLTVITLAEILASSLGTMARGTMADIALFLGMVGMILFRNNGRYALLVLLAIVAAAFVFGKKHRAPMRQLLINIVLALVAGSLLLSLIFRLTNAEQGDKREMLSVPIQQLARCMVYHGGVGSEDSISPQDKALINDFLLNESYRQYRPDISDPVKSHTNTYVVRYRTGEFVKTYLHLFTQYPGDYLNAVLATNAGYLYLNDISHAYINVNGRDRGLGYVQTRWLDEELAQFGLSTDSKFPAWKEILERFADGNSYLKVPIVKYLFVPGTWLWLYLFLCGWLLARRRGCMCLPLCLVFGYFLTLFLGPTVQLRYLYPVMTAFPFLLFLTRPHVRPRQQT